MTRRLSLQRARRVALAASGLSAPRPGGRVDVRHLRREIRRLGVLQLDFVTVLCPAHWQILFSRLGPFDPARLDDLAYRRRELTEQWAREASLIPMEHWPLLEPRRRAHRPRPRGIQEFLDERQDYVEAVLERIREHGPLAADELPEPGDTDDVLTHAWYRSVPRAVLETHFGQGRLVVARRRGDFARVYELTERVVPAALRNRTPSREEAERGLLRIAARALGVGTASDLAQYFRLPVRRVRPLLAAMVASGELEEVAVAGWSSPAYLHPQAVTPRRLPRARLLSPFDPLIAHRPRTRRLFGFDYRFEIFVPATKRRWGTYVLPFLMADRLVARVDLKALRDSGRLAVRAAFLEEDAPPEPTTEALAEELRTLADWLGLGEVEVTATGGFGERLRRVMG